MINTLIKISKPIDNRPNLEFLPYSPDVYFSRVTRPYDGYNEYYSKWQDAYPYKDYTVISEVKIGGEYYSVKESLGTCMIDDKSFYYDIDEQTIYLHMESEKTPWNTYEVINGMAFETHDTFSSHLYDEKYVTVYPRLMKLGPIEDKAYTRGGNVQFFDKSFSLENGDGALDEIITNDTFGRKVTFLFYDRPYEYKVSRGIIDEINYTRNKIELKCHDFRRRENFEFPTQTFGDAYPEFKEPDSKYYDLRDKVIPEVLGKVSYVKPTLIGETDSVWTFRVAQKIDFLHVHSVQYKDSNDKTKIIGVYSTRIENEKGEFDIPKSISKLKDHIDKVRVNVNNDMWFEYERYNFAPIMFRYLLEKYNSINFDSDNFDEYSFNIPTKSEVKNNLHLNTVGFYIDERTKFYDFVKRAQESTLLDFSYTQDYKGRRQIVIANRPHKLDKPKYSLRHTDLVNGDIKLRRRTSNMFGEIIIKFMRDQASNKFKDTYKMKIMDTFYGDRDAEKAFEALIGRDAKNNVIEIEADTGSYGEMNIPIKSYAYNNVRPYVIKPEGVYEIVLPIKDHNSILDATYGNFKYQLYDIIEMDTMNDMIYPMRIGGIIKGEVIKRKIDLDKLECTLTLRELDFKRNEPVIKPLIPAKPVIPEVPVTPAKPVTPETQLKPALSHKITPKFMVGLGEVGRMKVTR